MGFFTNIKLGENTARFIIYTGARLNEINRKKIKNSKRKKPYNLKFIRLFFFLEMA